MTVKSSFKEDVGGGVINIAIVFLSIALRGVVLSYLWLWFLVPLGLPVIGIMHALGISLIVTFLVTSTGNKHEQYPKKTKAIMGILFPLIVFVFGYVYHFWV